MDIKHINKKIFLLIDKNDISKKNIDDIINRLTFYLPHIPANMVNVIHELSQRIMDDSSAVFFYCSCERIPNIVPKSRLFHIDSRFNPIDGWDWCRLSNFILEHKANIEDAELRFNKYICWLKQQAYNKRYVFGTGPSLEKALDQNWSDGYRIVCNTIVRDPILWKHINPHFIVAGDAIYHFGHTNFAKQFRQDLAKRLNETETFFLYPDLFDVIVQRELSQFSNKLIPIPEEYYEKIHTDLTRQFIIPGLNNVLASLLLPLACTLPDKYRTALFTKENNVSEEKIRYLPISTGGEPIYEKGNYFREKFNIPAWKKILIYAGNIASWAMCEELVEAGSSLSEEYAIVLHFWRETTERDSFLNRLKQKASSNIYFSLQPLPRDLFIKAISSADAGLMFYRPIDENFTEIGSSSNKLSIYLKAGLPVIASDFKSIKEIFDCFKCGVCAASPYEMKPAIDIIFKNYSKYKEGALKAFNEHYNFERNFTPLLKEIKMILDNNQIINNNTSLERYNHVKGNIQVESNFSSLEKLILIVGSAHRVGSTWLFNILKNIGYFNYNVNVIPKRFFEMGTGILLLNDAEVFKYLTALTGRFIFKSHSYPITSEVKHIKFLTILRDPRDVLVSNSFYLARLGEKLGGLGEKYRSLSYPERILYLIKEEEFIISRLEQWYRTPLAYKIKYEYLKENPIREIKAILNHLDLPLKDENIKNVVEKCSFESMTGRKIGEEKKESPQRKGIIGDWKNYFNKDCIEAFKKEKNGRWNHLLVEMGYENDLDWL